MPLYRLDEFSFTVFEISGKPLLSVPLLDNKKSNTRTGINTNTVHSDTISRLRLHHFVDPCRLAFGAFNLGPAGHDPAFLPDARRVDVYKVEESSFMATQRLEEDKLSELGNVNAKSGIVLDIYTYNNGQKERVDLCTQPAALEAIFQYIKEKHKVKKDTAFPSRVAQSKSEGSCMFTGEEPLLHAMHIFERRWSSPMLQLLLRSSTRIDAQFQAAISNVHAQYAQWYQTAKVFAASWQPLVLNDDSTSLTEDSLNAALGSPTCHHLLDGMYMALHMEELLYLDKRNSSTVFSSGAVKESRIYEVDDAASLLWAMRYTIAIFTRYGTPQFLQIIRPKPMPPQNDQETKRKRDSSSSPGGPPRKRGGDGSRDGQRDREGEQGVVQEERGDGPQEHPSADGNAPQDGDASKDGGGVPASTSDDSVGSSHSTLVDASPEELKALITNFAGCASPASALPPPSDSALPETDSSDDEASMSDVQSTSDIVEPALVYIGGVKIVDPDPECIALDTEAVRIGALVLSSVFERVARA